jgi:2-polyprenyl-3-methyl-5-hydroxy-6-metoxy-1,4-benzoquinol methylase
VDKVRGAFGVRCSPSSPATFAAHLPVLPVSGERVVSHAKPVRGETLDFQDNTYDQFANQYASIVEKPTEGEFSPYHSLVLPYLLELVGDVTGLMVLDAGCGDGYVARILADHGARVVGADISHRLIELAQDSSSGRKIEYLVHDLSKPLPQYVHHFDLVVSNLVLNDVYDHVGFAHTLGSVLKRTGRLVLSMNNPYSAVMRNKVVNYFDSGKAVQYEGLASKGVRVFHFHRTFEEYVTAFRDAGFLLKSLSDVYPVKAMNQDSSVLQKYHHFPFFMVLEFVKGAKLPHP